MHDSVDNGNGKTEPSRGGFVTDLAVFLNDVCGSDFSAVLQVDRIGKCAPGNGQGQARHHEKTKRVGRGRPHNAILPRRTRGIGRTLSVDAQSCYRQFVGCAAVSHFVEIREIAEIRVAVGMESKSGQVQICVRLQKKGRPVGAALILR